MTTASLTTSRAVKVFAHESAARRRPAVTSASPSSQLAALTLAELRDYREALSAEEDKVSYWRRIIHARVDDLKPEGRSRETLSLADLVRVLGDTGSGRSRRSLIRVPARVELPDLPDLEELSLMWTMDPRPTDNAEDLVQRFRATIVKLSAYRNGLHERMDAATSELIVRYRAHPQAALALLPSV